MNEKDIENKSFNVIRQNTNKTLIAEKKESNNNEEIPLNFYNINKDIEINAPKNYLIDKRLIASENNNENNKLSSRKEKKIFRVIYRKIHSGDDIDNIKQMIIRDFINFFILLLNFIIEKRLPHNQNLKFQIDYKIKYKIKIEDIIKLNVEELLTFNHITKENISGKENKEKIRRIRNKIGNSLDKLFKTEVFLLFKEVYARKIINESDKEIDLNKFGVEGVIFKLDEEIPFFQKKKEIYKENKIKVNLMEQIVDKLIIQKKKILFNVKKI